MSCVTFDCNVSACRLAFDCYVSALCLVLRLIVTLVRFVVVVFDCYVCARFFVLC